MPNGERVVEHRPQIAGVKPKYRMNLIDQEGLGPWILDQARKGGSARKISDAVLTTYKIYIGYREIAKYCEAFRDHVTGEIIPEEKLPKIPDRHKPKAIANNIHEILEASQVNDLNALEVLANEEMRFFNDDEIPIGLKLKVAKELRETIKLKLEMGGVVKPPSTVNNTMIIDQGLIEQKMKENPEMVAMFREFLYMASGKAPMEGDIIDVSTQKE